MSSSEEELRKSTKRKKPKPSVTNFFDSSSSDASLKPTKNKAKKLTKKNDHKKHSKPSSNKTPSKKSAPKRPKSEAQLQREAKKRKEEEEEAECVWKWWEKPAEHPNGVKWFTLEHNGVLFPDEYVPHGKPVIYNNEPLKLAPDEEEVATMYAVMRESVIPPNDYYVNPVFKRNFFNDWLRILNRDPSRNQKRYGTAKHKIQSLEKCNFDPIWDWFSQEREKKRAMTGAEKKRIKEEKDAKDAPYKYCVWDGRKQPVGNFRVEPPSLFRGRGQHPRMGYLKARIQPEDIVINIGKDAKVPEPPPGHKWKEVKHDKGATWLAMWRDNVNDSFKYVMLGAASAIKGKSDWKKFQKAKKVDSLINDIRSAYREGWNARDEAVRQRAVAMYFIDKLALRCGNEKGEDEAETFGTCSLQVGHISFKENNTLHFDFLGKDSIRYQNSVVVDPKVYQLCKEFTRGKGASAQIFDTLQPSKLNDHLKTYMPGLSAKVFRTYNASKTLDKYFEENPCEKDVAAQEKVAYFTEANTQVAILCNHQKSVGKGHLKLMRGHDDRIDWLNEQIAKLEELQKSAKKSRDKAEKQWEEFCFEKVDEWVEKFGTPEDQAEWKAKHKGKKRKKRETPVKKEVKDGAESDDGPPLTKKAKKVKSTKEETKDVKLESD